MEKLTFEELPRAVNDILIKLKNIERIFLEKDFNQQAANKDQILNVSLSM